jgi:hypothetical protein
MSTESLSGNSTTSGGVLAAKKPVAVSPSLPLTPHGERLPPGRPVNASAMVGNPIKNSRCNNIIEALSYRLETS